MDPSFKRRAFVVCLALVAGLTVLSYRLITLQVLDRKISNRASIPGFKNQEVIPANRGFIVDRNDTIIARNRPEATLIADAKHLKTPAILKGAVCHRIASQVPGWKSFNEAEKGVLLKKTRRQIVAKISEQELIDEHLAYATEVIGRELRMPSGELTSKIQNGSARIVVKKRMGESLARRLEKELQIRCIQGFRFERSQKRYYPMPTFAPHLIGNLNYQGFGESGLERSMEPYLAGRDGSRQLKRNINGLVNLTEAAEVTPPKMGKHVKLTLDMGIQAIVEEELEMAFEAFKAQKGSIIVVEPQSGDILAMASRPHFHLNTREGYANPTSGTNFAVSAQYESGSVMKIVGMAAALDQGAARRETVVDCGWGIIRRPGYQVRDHHQYNELSFDSVLAKSSNTGAFLFAERVGKQRFYQYLRDFGFGERTGFRIPGEARGRIQDGTNNQHFASATYGYGVAVTPLQLAMAYSALANGGLLLKPRLVQSIIANNGTELEEIPVRQVRRVLGERAARDMCFALEQVVLRGTGRRARVKGYRAGGKTGTAEKWNNTAKRYDQGRKFLTFAGMLPVDAPRFVCIVTIDEPSGFPEDFSVGGGTIAAPIFSQAAGRIARFMNLNPVEESLENDSLVLNPNE